jgi:hypothetical protein
MRLSALIADGAVAFLQVVDCMVDRLQARPAATSGQIAIALPSRRPTAAREAIGRWCGPRQTLVWDRLMEQLEQAQVDRAFRERIFRSRPQSAGHQQPQFEALGGKHRMGGRLAAGRPFRSRVARGGFAFRPGRHAYGERWVRAGRLLLGLMERGDPNHKGVFAEHRVAGRFNLPTLTIVPAALRR